METVNIVGLGSTAKLWNGEGYSIGLNDAWSIHKTDCLVAANRPGKFPQARLEVIKRSRPAIFYSPLNAWKIYFPDVFKEIKIRSWDGHLYNDTVIHTNTSASIAMDLARKQGAKNIILWGIEYINHATFNEDNPQTKTELRQLKAITEAFKEVGVNVWLGAKGSALETFLPIWGQ